MHERPLLYGTQGLECYPCLHFKQSKLRLVATLPYLQHTSFDALKPLFGWLLLSSGSLSKLRLKVRAYTAFLNNIFSSILTVTVDVGIST